MGTSSKELVRSTLKKDAFIMINKKLAKLIGIVEEIYLAHLLSKEEYFESQNQLTEEGEFYNTQEDVKENTLIPFHIQSRIIKKLKELGIIDVRKRQIPAKNFFKINHSAIEKLLSLDLSNLDDKSENSSSPVINHLNDQSLTILMTSDEPDYRLYNKNKIEKEIITDAFYSKASEVPDGTTTASSDNSSGQIIKRRTSEQENLSKSQRRKFSADGLRPAVEPPPVKRPPRLTSDIKAILDYWEEQGLKMPAPDKKAYENCIKQVRDLLSGRLFGEKYEPEQIRESILYFSFAALDSDFEPEDVVYKKTLAKMTIADFIHNPFRQNGNSSLFRKYLGNKPKAVKNKEVVKDEFPSISLKLRKFYEREVVGNARVSLSQKDINCFNLAAIKLKQFEKSNQGKFNPFMRWHDNTLAEWLIEAIKADVGNDVSKIAPGWFSSGTTFNRRFPAYLFKQAILQGDNGSGHHPHPPPDDLQIEY